MLLTGIMASFGTGVATGKLHEMIEATMATDWENVSIHKFTNQPEPDQENNLSDNDTHQGNRQVYIKVGSQADTVSENMLDKEQTISGDVENKLKTDSPDGRKLEPNNQKTIEVVCGAEGMDSVHPPPKELTEQTLDSGLHETENDVIEAENDSKDNTSTDLKLSQEIVDEFEKHVHTKRTSKSESQPTHLEQPSKLESDNNYDATISKGFNNSHRSVTMATYTCSKPAKQITDRQTPGTKSKAPSGPPSRQTTSSSAGGRGDSQSECSSGKPDSGYSRRRQRRRQEDTKSNHSRYREDSRDEATGGQPVEKENEFHKKNDGYLNDRFQSPRQPYEDGRSCTIPKLCTSICYNPHHILKAKSNFTKFYIIHFPGIYLYE